MPARKTITADSLLGRNPQGWHDGSETLTYSFLENIMPDYVKTRDKNGDGTPDVYLPLQSDRIRVGVDFSMTETERDLVRRAVGLWNDMANINLAEGTVTGGFGDITFGSAAFADKGTFGFITQFPRSGSLGTADNRGDLWINSNNPDQDVSEFGHTSWDTYLHEMGHTLGLHHPNEDPNNFNATPHNNNRYTVMSYNPHPGERDLPADDQAWPLTPMLYDIQALQKLYGANTDTRNGDTVYFGAGDGGGAPVYQYAADGMTVNGRPVILTLWDGGGDDLVDVSALDQAVRIDLRAGHFSTIGALDNNVAMAAAVRVAGKIVNLIEHARAGGGNDRLHGNRAGNALDGGAGDDVLRGARGDDVLTGGSGQDLLRGGAGADVFVFDGAKNEGRDHIGDFSDGQDLLEISGGRFGDLHIRTVGDDTHVALDSGTVIILENLDSSLLTQDDFTFG